MNVLLDTHLLLWTAFAPERLAPAAVEVIDDAAHALFFSPVSLWEVVIKNALGRADFSVDPHMLRRGLHENEYRELSIESRHVLAVAHLPPLHRDPFDRLLVAQASSEGFILLTADATLAGYAGPVRMV